MYSNVIDGQVKKSIEAGRNVNISDLFSRGWTLTKKTLGIYIGLLVVLTLVLLLIVFILGFSSFNLIDLIINRGHYFSSPRLIFWSFLFNYAIIAILAPLGVGFYYVAHREYKFKMGNVLDIIKGYQHFFPIAVASILINIPGALLDLTQGFLPMWLIIILKFVVSILFIFTSSLIAFKNYNFLIAIQTSYKIVSKNFLQIFLITVLLILLNIVGALILLVGLLITIPLSICVGYLLFDFYCLEAEEEGLTIEDNLIEI